MTHKMLLGSTNPIRNYKDNEKFQQQAFVIWTALIDVHTGVKFTSEEQRSSFEMAWTSHIINNYPMIGLNEVALAFDMAASGRLDIDLETYYGKFTVLQLGKLMRKYLDYRKKVLAAYSDKTLALTSRPTEEVIADRNEQTRLQVIAGYQELINTFKETHEIDKEKIKPFWAKILVDNGLIELSKEDKVSILGDAYELTQTELMSGVISGKVVNHLNTKELRDILTEYKKHKECLKNGVESQTPVRFKDLAIEKYKTMLVYKSIILNN